MYKVQRWMRISAIEADCHHIQDILVSQVAGGSIKKYIPPRFKDVRE